MKALKTINKPLLILGLLAIIVSCTNDPIVEDINSENYTLEIEKDSRETGTVLITFYEEVKEEDKEGYRQFYYDAGILLDWKVCDLDTKSEVWTVMCDEELSCKQGNPPINHNKPVPGQTERIIFGYCPK